MRKTMTRLMLVLCAFYGLMLGGARAQTVERIDVTEFGIYTADTKQIVSAPQSTTGIAQRVSASSIKLAKATTTVPGRIGVRFGFRYRIIGDGQSVTLRRIVHIPEPGVHNPEKGIILTSEVHADTAIGPLEIAGYQFGHDWEIVPGTWTIELWDGDRKLASQSFQVVKG
jgi:hypothetical protein